MSWPTVSVIITSLNRASYIQRTILSILRQDYPGDIEVIVADGGSTDGTVEILRRYPQVTWWSEKDGGIVDAINRGLGVATGQFVAIQDSDNFYLRDAFRLTLDPVQSRPDIDIFTGCDVYLEPDGRTFVCSPLDDHEITAHSLLMRRVIPIHCAFIRRDIIEPAGGFRTFSRLHDSRGGNVGNVGIDIDFWYRALHVHRGLFVPHHTAVYQKHADQMSNHSGRWFVNLTEMVERCESDPSFASRVRLSGSDKRNLYFRWQIQQERLSGNEDRVRQLLNRATTDPAFTAETREYLAVHGFLPREPHTGPRPRHPNHRVPELHWYNQPMERARAA